jgi:hypothetical protein
VSELLPEAEKLFAVTPERFVEERKALADQLRKEGRSEDAAAVEALRKPSAVVSAVNRAARDRPKAAEGAVEAAVRLKKAQVSGDQEAFRGAVSELDAALDLLADVALAHVAPQGKSPTEAMRRRVRDLLRSAVADDDARDALARGALTEELETPGFSPFAGMAVQPVKSTKATGPTRAEKREEEKRAREEALRQELDEAEQELKAATKAARDAEAARARAERRVETLRKRLE